MPGTITFLSRVSSEFGHLDEVLRSQLAPLPAAVIKTPIELSGYGYGSGPGALCSSPDEYIRHVVSTQRTEDHQEWTVVGR
jgi:hypothetical protein